MQAVRKRSPVPFDSRADGPMIRGRIISQVAIDAADRDWRGSPLLRAPGGWVSGHADIGAQRVRLVLGRPRAELRKELRRRHARPSRDWSKRSDAQRLYGG